MSPLTLKASDVADARSQIDEIDRAIVILLSALVAPDENPQAILHELAEIASSSRALRSILNDGDTDDEDASDDAPAPTASKVAS